MKFLTQITLLTFVILFLFSCKKDSNTNPKTIVDDGSCQIIKNEGGWHLIRQQLEPASGDAKAVTANNLVYINSGLYLQTKEFSFSMTDYVADDHYSTEGKTLSLSGKDDNPELDPRFYFEGDTSHRIGLYNKTSIYKDGQTVFTFPSNLYYNLTVSNLPFIGYFYGANLFTLNLETNELLNRGGYAAQGLPTDFTEMHFWGTFVFDKYYMESNKGKTRLAYSCYNNISYNGHPPHYLSTYLAEDKGSVTFCDTTSMFWQLGVHTSRNSASDKNNFYFLYGDLLKGAYTGQDHGHLLLLVVDKATGKIKKTVEYPEVEYISDICSVENKNYLAITVADKIYKINLSDYSLSDISPVSNLDALYSGTFAGPYKLASDGNKLYIAMGIAAGSGQNVNIKSSINLAYYE
ncbi:MAG: hypothetical protein HXX13_03465 [Bacteroidetes bacterium]|nr:hypothetical protein [Bacteroidota bacterium]